VPVLVTHKQLDGQSPPVTSPEVLELQSQFVIPTLDTHVHKILESHVSTAVLDTHEQVLSLQLQEYPVLATHEHETFSIHSNSDVLATQLHILLEQISPDVLATQLQDV